MKKNYILFFLLISFITEQLTAQDSLKQREFYVNFKTYDEILFGFEKEIREGQSFSVELGYNFGGKKGVYADNGFPFYPRFFFLQSADKGFTILGSLNFLCKNKNKWSIEYFYRRLYSENLIYDPGYFAGTNSSTYEEYDLISNENVFLISYSITKLKPVIFYFGAGVQLSFQEKRYSISGPYISKTPSNKIEKNIVINPLIKIGCKFCLFKF